MTTDDVYKVGVSSWLNGQLGLNVRYYRVTATGGFGTTDQALAEGIFAYLGPLYADMMPDSAEVLGVAVRNLTQLPLTVFEISTGASIVGTVASEELPTQTSGVITLGTGLSGRANRGRAFIPFPSVADQDTDGRPDTSYMTGLAALAVGFLADITVVSGGNSVTVEPILKASVPLGQGRISSATARRAWGTQRSRGTYGAANPKVIAAV